MSVDKHCTVGVDVGGTFTDIFMFDQASQAVKIVKTPSTIDDQSRGLVDGVSQSIDDFSAILNIVHGTTTGTNALLERKGARTGIITTRGRSKRKSGNPSSLSRENGKPPVSTSPNQLSTLQQQFACARLPASFLPRSGLDFSATLTTIALYDSSLQLRSSLGCRSPSKADVSSPHSVVQLDCWCAVGPRSVE